MKRYIKQSEQIADSYKITTYRGHTILRLGYADASKLSQQGFQNTDIDYRGYSVMDDPYSPVFSTLEETKDYIDMKIDLFGDPK